ncbi:MAG: helix-turn-helix transcriptional regulator [Clostridia bacterium]|nr:helix-turn-helix transcriptional regulator [Clostridia bacterium]
MYEIKFKENLRILRRDKNWTQSELAKMVGVDQRTISAWEQGVCEPNFSMLFKLCELFDETIEGLLT